MYRSALLLTACIAPALAGPVDPDTPSAGSSTTAPIWPAAPVAGALPSTVVVVPEPPRFDQLEGGASHTTYSDVRSSENVWYGQYAAQIRQSATLTTRISEEDRYDQPAHVLGVTLGQAVGDGIHLNVGGAATPGSDWHARWEMSAGVGITWPTGPLTGLGVTHQLYDDGSVDRGDLALGLGRIGNGGLILLAHWLPQVDRRTESESGSAFQGDLVVAMMPLMLAFTARRGLEIDPGVPNALATTVSGMIGIGTITPSPMAGPGFSLSLTGTWQQRDDTYIARTVGIALGVSF